MSSSASIPSNATTFAVAVHGAPYGSTAHQHALGFVEAALKAGHSVQRVFFYHEAVYAALATRVVPQDENDVTLAWQTLAQQYQFELAVCIANGLKRGVITADEAQRVTASPTLASGFELVGLGQLTEAVIQADRYIEFAA